MREGLNRNQGRKIVGLPKFRVTFRAPRGIFHKEEIRSQIIEAKTLYEAEETAHLGLGNYPKDWTVSVEELSA
jgi:hypothetical protein